MEGRIINLIGIRGGIGHGKDTVATMIQYLTQLKYYDDEGRSYNSFIIDVGCGSEPDWEIKKFAGKLKQIASIITGVLIHLWEDQEFKKKEMPEQWGKYCYDHKMMIAGDNVKTGQLVYITKESYDTYREQLELDGLNPKVVPITYRQFLQKLGTEVGREIHVNTWVNALFEDYKSGVFFMCDRCGAENIERLLQVPNRFPEEGHTDDEFVCPHCKGAENEGDITMVLDAGYSKWIISDVRFPNEVQAIKDRGGIVIEVFRQEIADQQKEQDNHASETGLIGIEPDYLLDNSGLTLEQTVENVKKMLQHFKIID